MTVSQEKEEYLIGKLQRIKQQRMRDVIQTLSLALIHV